VGLTACPSLGLLATSDRGKNTLSLWQVPSMPSALAGHGLVPMCTLGGAGSPPPMQFSFPEGSGNLRLAFTAPVLGSTSRPLLLATDAGADAVHIVDVVGRSHVGYVAPPGSIAGPRGVAASGASPQLVAVSAWKTWKAGTAETTWWWCTGAAAAASGIRYG
jgi:hypothetical protein